jgi:hypothetical protein
MSEASGGALVLEDVKAIDFERFLTMLYAKFVPSLHHAYCVDGLAGSTIPPNWPRPRSGSPSFISRTSGTSHPSRPSPRVSSTR